MAPSVDWRFHRRTMAYPTAIASNSQLVAQWDQPPGERSALKVKAFSLPGSGQ
jgi:hypothetical protein